MRIGGWITGLVVVVSFPACRVGGSWDAETVSAPYGGDVEVQAGSTTATGELLMVRGDGVVFLHDGRATVVHWDAIDRLAFPDHPVEELRGGEGPSSRHRREMELASRYPYGLTDDQLQRVLEGLGQSELAVLP